jgi:hypothetical protein
MRSKTNNSENSQRSRTVRQDNSALDGVSPMTPEELTKLFARYYEDAQFQLWNKGKAQEPRFVYACENGTVWKFTPREWWQTVTKAIRDQGCHKFFASKPLISCPRHIIKGADNNFYSSDITVRCVNPQDWKIENWTNELGL